MKKRFSGPQIVAKMALSAKRLADFIIIRSCWQAKSNPFFLSDASHYHFSVI